MYKEFTMSVSVDVTMFAKNRRDVKKEIRQVVRQKLIDDMPASWDTDLTNVKFKNIEVNVISAVPTAEVCRHCGGGQEDFFEDDDKHWCGCCGKATPKP